MKYLLVKQFSMEHRPVSLVCNAHLIAALAFLVAFVLFLDVGGHQVPDGRSEVAQPALVAARRRRVVHLVLLRLLPVVLLFALLGVDAPPVHLKHLLPLRPVVAILASKSS